MGVPNRVDASPTNTLVRKPDPAARLDVTTPVKVARASQQRDASGNGRTATPKASAPKASIPRAVSSDDITIDIDQLAAAPAPPVKPSKPSWLLSAALAATVGFVVWWVMFERMPDIDPRQVIATNLAAAQQAFDDQRYVEPSDRSALHYYSTVLAIDPANEPARSGIDRIADHYIQDARTRFESGRLADAALALERVRRVRPEHSDLPALDERVRGELSRILTAARTPAVVIPPVVSPATNPPVSKTQKSQRSAAPPVVPIRLAQLDSARTLIGESQSNLGGQLIRDARKATGSNDYDGAARTLAQARDIGFTGGDLDAAEAALLTARTAPVLTSSSTLPPRKVRTLVQPTYPENALMRGIEGWVDVSLLVTPAGDVIEPRVASSLRGRVFDRAALNAVSQWKYEPRVTSEPEPLQVRIEFQLKD